MDRRPAQQKRRSFKVCTKFGSSRQWRSRKNRPCDTCRRRKTACIIETLPPCRFCRTRGLPCRSTEGELGRSSRSSRQDTRDDQGSEMRGSSTARETSTTVDAIEERNDYLTGYVLHGVQGASPSEERCSAQLEPANNPGSLEWTISKASRATYSQLPVSLGAMTELPVHTLEDNENRTAHSMGLAGEQDTDLLASFRSVIINERDGVSADVFQVDSGDSARHEPPIHFNILHDEFQSADDIAKARASETIEAMVSPHAPNLVRLFFEHVHPVYCVVSKARFLRAYETDKLKIPASLRGAIYGLASMFWQHDRGLEGILPFDLHDLFEEAQSSLQRELHAPNLWKLQACLLLLYERPADNATIETPRTWVFSAHIVACAQMIGLHRDPTHWQILTWEKKLRKRLWWATYVADIWSAVCHGNPPHVYPASFTTVPPDMDDLAFDENVPEELGHMIDARSRTVDISTCARFLEMVKLSQILHELIDHYYSDCGYMKSLDKQRQRETNLLEIKRKLEAWYTLVPYCVTMSYSREEPASSNNAQLNLAFFAVRALLFRALMSPAKMSAKSDPNSTLCRYFDHAVAQFEAFTAFMNEITLPYLHAFWGGHARSQLTLCGNFLIYLFLLAPSPEQVHIAFRLLGRFHESLQRLREWADDDASLGLLRPVALRIDSFFIQAAQIMRTGMGSRVLAETS